VSAVDGFGGSPSVDRPVVMIYNVQNEIVHPDGYIGARGNAALVAERGVLGNIARVLAAARANGVHVFYVGNGYNENYDGLNTSVPLFAEHGPGRRMLIGTWGTEFHHDVAPTKADTVVFRAGIGSFANSDIGNLLPAPDSVRVYLAGVSTRLVVEAAVFELTDRGYGVTVLEDCCAAANPDAHADALKTLALFATVGSADDFIESLGTGDPHRRTSDSAGLSRDGG
jgi:nicotinamidase-related amidase